MCVGEEENVGVLCHLNMNWSVSTDAHTHTKAS